MFLGLTVKRKNDTLLISSSGYGVEKIFLLKTKDDVREIIATTMQKVLIPACKPFNSYEII